MQFLCVPRRCAGSVQTQEYKGELGHTQRVDSQRNGRQKSTHKKYALLNKHALEDCKTFIHSRLTSVSKKQVE